MFELFCNLFSTIYAVSVLIVILVIVLSAGHREKDTSGCLASECSEKECKYFDEETGCLLGWNKAGTCPYVEQKSDKN